MPNVTISINDELLKAGREYARKHNTSLNSLIRGLLERTIKRNSVNWLDDCFRKMDNAKGNSRGETWRREDLYDA